MTVIVFCPECNHRLKLGARPHIGQRSVCPRCDTNLGVVSLDPLELDIYDIRVPSIKTSAKKKAVAEAYCPECDRSLKLGAHPRKGQQILCPGCRIDLEVISLDPLELDVPVATGKRIDGKG